MMEMMAQGTAETVGVAVGAAVLVLTGGKGLSVLAQRRQTLKGSRTPDKCILHDVMVKDLTEIKNDLRMLVEHLLNKGP